MRFERTKFFNGFRKWRGEITSQQVKGLNYLLDAVEKDRFVQRIDWFAYMLATTMIETAYTFMPIHEYGGKAYFIRRYGSQTRVGRVLGNDTPEEGAIYAGRGDVQLTGESNYEKAEIALRREYAELIADFEQRTGKRFDLTVGDQPNDLNDPNNAQDPAIAYAIMSYGMRTGMFTGRKLSDYFSSTRREPLQARRIINGMDNAEKFQSAFLQFEVILKQSYMQDIPKVEAVISNTEIVANVERSENQFIDSNALNESEIAETEQGSNEAEKPSENALNGEQNNSENVSVEVKDGNVKVETNKDEKPSENELIAIEKPAPKNFIERMWKKITGFFGGTSITDVATEKLSQVQALGLSADFWKRLFYLAVIAGLIWLAVEIYKHFSDNKRDLAITDQLIQANSTATNIVKLVPSDELESYKTKGYKIITR